MIRRSDHVYAMLSSARTPEMKARLDLRLTGACHVSPPPPPLFIHHHHH
jgi:hypothetical protein